MCVFEFYADGVFGVVLPNTLIPQLLRRLAHAARLLFRGFDGIDLAPGGQEGHGLRRGHFNVGNLFFNNLFLGRKIMVYFNG